ncbi:MAG: alpha-amylase [Chloroflexi bacterium]|nr:alpha-amylase [Chloroflexota bacterium]
MAKKKHLVSFSLFAPYNEDVTLIGDWNDWEPVEMQRRDDGWWHVGLPLDDGEYQYKFRLKSNSYFQEGQNVAVTDPRALRVTRDQQENAIVRVKDGQRVVTTYEWQHNDVHLPQNHELIIYETHIGDFTGETGEGLNPAGEYFKKATERLDYLADLGINAVELMPVNDFPGGYSWGYNPRFLFAVENSYGSPDDLCRLIDECHARGIRVILDGVYNHSEDKTPLAHMDYAYWYYRENPDDPEHHWGPKFNYGYHDDKLGIWPARSFIHDALRFWIDHFHIDGIRFDATAIIENYDVLHWLNETVYQYIKGIKPFFTIAEHVPQDPTVTGLGGPMDAAWHETFSKQIMATLCARDQDGFEAFNMDAIATVLQPTQEGFDSAYNAINYIDNHDQNRIMWRLGEAGIFDDAAFRRMKLGAGLLLTAAGIPMLWMGQEFGQSNPKTVFDPQPLQWSLLDNERNGDLHRYYKGLIHFRKDNPALVTPNIEVIHLDHERKILAFKRWNDEGNVVIVVANLLDQYAGDVEIGNWHEDGAWHEYLDDYDIEVQGGVLRDTLAESEVKVYVKAG